MSCLKYLLETGAVSNLTYLNPSYGLPWRLSGIKSLPANAGDAGSIPGSGRSSGGEGMAPHSSILAWGQRSLVGYSPWGHEELGMTKQQQQSYLIDGTQKNLPGLEFCTKNCNLNYFSYN